VSIFVCALVCLHRTMRVCLLRGEGVCIIVFCGYGGVGAGNPGRVVVVFDSSMVPAAQSAGLQCSFQRCAYTVLLFLSYAQYAVL
jgi:hypothetical protein